MDFVQKQSFLTGWFGNRRPLTAIEIMNLHFNFQRNVIGKHLMMGFAQTAYSEKVKKFCLRVKAIAEKQVDVFSSILGDDELLVPMSLGMELTDSVIPPFSDKLIIYHTAALSAAGIGYLGASLGSSQRRDLAAHYINLTADGVNIMINNAWLEQPPTNVDRDALTEKK